MIDTLKLLIPITDLNLLEHLKGELTHTSRKDLKTSELKFEYWTGEIETESHSRKINFKLNDLGIFFEFSVPKYAYGNNVEMIRPTKLPEILETFRQELCQSVAQDLPPLSEWIVYRLDLCYNWTLVSKEACQSLMNFIHRIDYPRKKKITFDTSVMYLGSVYTLKFYLKGAEFLVHDFKSLLEKNEDHTHRLANWAHKILRFEVEFRRGYFETLFEKKKVSVFDIADEEYMEEILRRYLANVFKYVNKENMKYEDVRQLINKNFSPSKALRLYQFYKGYYYNADEKYHIMKGLNASTIWRYKNDLRSIGVSFTENLGEAKFVSLDELLIPSSRAHFTLLDYQSSKDYS